jgi:hypothetical protein
VGWDGFFFSLPSPITRWKLWKNAEWFSVCVCLSFDTAWTELKLDRTSLTVESTDRLKWQVFQVRRNRPSARNSMYLLSWQSWRSFSSCSYLKTYKLCSLLSPWLWSKWFSHVTRILPTPFPPLFIILHRCQFVSMLWLSCYCDQDYLLRDLEASHQTIFCNKLFSVRQTTLQLVLDIDYSTVLTFLMLAPVKCHH